MGESFSTGEYWVKGWSLSVFGACDLLRWMIIYFTNVVLQISLVIFSIDRNGDNFARQSSYLPWLFTTSTWNKNHWKSLILIWHIIVWKIWEVRNKIIFSSKGLMVEKIVKVITYISWKCFLAKKNDGFGMLYEWFNNPLFCMTS